MVHGYSTDSTVRESVTNDPNEVLSSIWKNLKIQGIFKKSLFPPLAIIIYICYILLDFFLIR